MISEKDLRQAVHNAVIHPENHPSDIKDDLTQEMWVQLLTSPANVRRLESSPYRERINMLSEHAKQVLWKVVYDNLHNTEQIFASVEMVKAVLKGESSMPLLVELVKAARLELEHQDNPYADAIRRRYDEGVIPHTLVEQNQQKFAHVKLTDEVNAAYRRLFEPPESYYDGASYPFPTLNDGPGSKHAVEASSRKASGGHSDPTADAAIALLEADPEERALLLEETPLAKILKGRG